ncbi:MAG: ornithine carbamoyltransferase, partial [Thiotrichales bacterium]|nr:ornithine carbamoyltransferase [Thiotrichales bacterium]
MTVRHFLTLNDFSRDELLNLIDHAITLKQALQRGSLQPSLAGKTLAMIFEKSSTRTRVSFETAMNQLGGVAIFLSPHDTQLGRGEPVEDTARVLSKMVDAVMVRTYEHEKLERFAEHAAVPVINGLSDSYHPCQLLADIQTYVEHRGSISGCTVAWLGDGNNMCHSWINAAQLLQFNLNIACPDDYRPAANLVDVDSDNISIGSNPVTAVTGADLVVTDVWASMGQEQEQEQRHAVFAPFQVNEHLMSLASDSALFMHCLPAHRGDEVTAGVIDGPHSVVWDEAGNRLHAQKALLEFLL